MNIGFDRPLYVLPFDHRASFSEDDQKVRHWFTTVAAVPGFIGFAIGRTAVWDPLVNYLAKKINRETAVKKIAASYEAWVDVFARAKQGSEAASAVLLEH